LGIVIFLVLFVVLFTLPYFGKTQEKNTTQEFDEPDSNSPEFESIEGSGCIPDLRSYEVAELVEVIDGDSIRVEMQGELIEVRYIGIDAPEYYSDERNAAMDSTQKNRVLLGDGHIYLFKDISNTDKYDRLLRYVIASGYFINLEMVRSGYAEAKKYQPDISCQAVFEKADTSLK